MRLGGLNTQTFTWSDFVEVIKVPIIVNNEINIDDMSKKLITDINFNKPIELSSELPGQTLELTPGYQDGGVAVKINEVQHIELDGNSFSNVNMNIMTFSAWIKPDSVLGNQTILSRYGLENNIKFKMVDNELMLSINNADNPVFKSLTGTKQYDLTTTSYKVNVSGRVKDASGGKLYVFAMFNDYAVNYLEDIIVQYAKTNVIYVPFQQDNIYFSFEKEITTYAHSVDSVLTSDIQFDSDFFVYFVGIDTLQKATVEKLHYNKLVNLTTVDSGFEIKNVILTVTQSIHVEYTITTPLSNPVEVHAVAYMHPTDFPTNYTKIADLNAGLTNSERTFTLTELYNKTTNQTVSNIAAVNTIYLYLYAVDTTNGQRVSGNEMLVIEERGPYVYIPNVLYDQFNKQVTISDATIFTSTYVQTVYPPVVFESSVSLSDYGAVLEFYRRYFTPLNVYLQPYTVEPLDTFELYDAFTALDGTKEKIVDGNYKIVMLFVMSDGSIKIKPGGGGTGLSIPTVKWATSGFVNNQDSGDMYWGQDWIIHMNTQLSGDGNRFLATNHTGNHAYIYEYNLQTQEWGKFDVNGAFTKDDRHNLTMSGFYGNYGINGCISADGNTVIVGSSLDHYRGAAYIWQFDESTYQWGKFNAYGSFTAGTPHTVGDNNMTWREGHPYCHYGQSCSLSADGKRALIGGGYNDNNRFRCYIWDYDESTATWGGFNNTDGTYQANTPYEIYKSGNNWGYGGIKISMSYDGKRLMFSNHVGTGTARAGVMDYHEDTREWGKLELDGTFTSHTSEGYANNGFGNDHISLNISGGVNGQIGAYSQLSGDGKTVALMGYHNHDHGATIVWQFNEETYEWGKFGPNYETFTSGEWHYLEKHSGVGHHGQGGAISADGRTIIVSGSWQNGNNKVFLWEYNPKTAEWGKFKEDGSFVAPTSITDHSATHYFNHSSNVTAYSNISGDGSTVMVGQSTQVRLWKGLITQEERSIVSYTGGGGIGKHIKLETVLSTTVDSVEFKELSGGASFAVYDVDWSNETTNNDNTSTGDYRLTPGTAANPNVEFGTNRMVVGKPDNNTGGKVRVYDYNDATDEWGKFDANGSFTKDVFYNLDLANNPPGHYGYAVGISLDDKTIVSGGYHNATGYGCLFVWHYNEETAEWGKFNTEGSFVTEPHDLSNPSNSWIGHSPHCKKISVSIDGKRFTFSGGQHSNNGRIYIIDYD